MEELLNAAMILRVPKQTSNCQLSDSQLVIDSAVWSLFVWGQVISYRSLLCNLLWKLHLPYPV
jgi:hypothetical protein